MSNNKNDFIRGFFGKKKVCVTPLQEKNNNDFYHVTGRDSSGDSGLKSVQLENDTVISVTFSLLIDIIVTIIRQTDNNNIIRFIHCDTPKTDSRAGIGPKFPTAKYADRDNNQTYIIFDKIERLLHIQLDGRYDTEIPKVLLKKEDGSVNQLELKKRGLLFFADEYLPDGDYELIMEIQRTKGKKTLEEIYEKKDLCPEAPPSGMRFKR